MVNKKTWILFLVFFLLSFSFISFNFEYESTADKNKASLMVEDFVRNQLSEEQINTTTPIRWRKPLLYSIDFYGDSITTKKRAGLIEKLLIDLSRVTRLPLKKVESEKANLKFIFSPDWRATLLEYYPEIKDLRRNTLVMDDEEYKSFWMTKKQSIYVFRDLKISSNELVSSTVFLNNQLENDNCQISVNIARILVLSPVKKFSYTNTCLKDKLPVFEEAFLKVYYSKKYDEFLDQYSAINKDQVVDFFVNEMMNSLDKSLTLSKDNFYDGNRWGQARLIIGLRY